MTHYKDCSQCGRYLTISVSNRSAAGNNSFKRCTRSDCEFFKLTEKCATTRNNNYNDHKYVIWLSFLIFMGIFVLITMYINPILCNIRLYGEYNGSFWSLNLLWLLNVYDLPELLVNVSILVLIPMICTVIVIDQLFCIYTCKCNHCKIVDDYGMYIVNEFNKMVNISLLSIYQWKRHYVQQI